MRVLGRHLAVGLALSAGLACSDDSAPGADGSGNTGASTSVGGAGAGGDAVGGDAGAGGDSAPCGSPPDGATLTLSATFRSIGLTAVLSDPNDNSAVTVRFRQLGEPWRDGYAPFVDRRDLVDGEANPHAGEARGSIVGLSPDTAYEVCVTVVDPDGNSGELAGSTTTLSYAPKSGGATLDVSNDVELAGALDAVEPGQIIRLAAGTYAPFTIDRSGNADEWIVVEGAGIGSTVITSGASQNIAISASFIVLKDLDLAPSSGSGVVTSGTHIFIQDLRIQDVSTACAADPAGHYADAGVSIGGSDTYVLRTTILSPTLSASCSLDPPWESPGLGIAFAHDPLANIVLEDNTIDGGFRDGIGTFGAGQLENVDISGHAVSGHKDDGIEVDSTAYNVREWGNAITVDKGDTCFSAQPAKFGPVYLFRNTCRITTSATSGLTVYKLGGDASPIYFFHNSTDSSPSPNHWDGFACGAIASVAMNNIVNSSGTALYGCGSAQTFDYNLYYESVGYDVVSNWNGSESYTTVAEWNEATGQEAHGLEADPAFSDPELHITSASPAHDAGVAIPNFNDASSAWPAVGPSPDIGRYEVR